MNTSLKNPKAIAVMATVACIASLLWLMSIKSVNSSLESGLEREKLRSESLLSEKLLLEKDLEKLKTQLASLRGINSELDALVTATEGKLVARDLELRRLKKQDATLASLRKERQELLRLQTQLENELLSAHTSLADMMSQNEHLSQTVAQLQEQNRMLANDLNRVSVAALDRLQVEAVKGKKERLTVRARRASKLIASFKVPASMQNISFRIIAPKGEILGEKQGIIASRITPLQDNAMASANNQTIDGLQEVRMEYLPKQRLQSGVYTVEILNDQLYVGSLNVKLR